MTVRQWASEHSDLLRRLLCVAFVWRVAFKIITENLDHENTASCLVCEALLRNIKHKHSPVIGTKRVVFCKKCGLPQRLWKARCSNTRPKPGVEVITNPVRVVPINW